MNCFGIRKSFMPSCGDERNMLSDMLEHMEAKSKLVQLVIDVSEKLDGSAAAPLSNGDGEANGVAAGGALAAAPENRDAAQAPAPTLHELTMKGANWLQLSSCKDVKVGDVVIATTFGAPLTPDDDALPDDCGEACECLVHSISEATDMLDLVPLGSTDLDLKKVRLAKACFMKAI